jgi:hypothetical protein
MVNCNDGLIKSYQSALQKIRLNNDREAVDTLIALGSPSWVNPRNFEKLRNIIYKLEFQVTDEPLNFQAAAEYTTKTDRGGICIRRRFFFY